MKICLVLLALMVAVACGHNKDGEAYAAKKAAKLSFKVSLSFFYQVSTIISHLDLTKFFEN